MFVLFGFSFLSQTTQGWLPSWARLLREVITKNPQEISLAKKLVKEGEKDLTCVSFQKTK